MPLGGRIMSGSGGSRQVEVMCLDVGRAWPSAGGLGQRSLGPCPSSKRPVRKAQHGLPTVPPLVFVLQIVCSLAGRAMGPRPGPRGVLSPSFVWILAEEEEGNVGAFPVVERCLCSCLGRTRGQEQKIRKHR